MRVNLRTTHFSMIFPIDGVNFCQSCPIGNYLKSSYKEMQKIYGHKSSIGNALGCRNSNFLDNREYYVF